MVHAGPRHVWLNEVGRLRYIQGVPTILQADGFRFFFYSSDRPEPAHVHVERGNGTAKVWVEPVRLQSSRGFSNREVGEILKRVENNKELILRSWNEFFND